MISDNVFVATVYITEIEQALADSVISREQFDMLAVAINTGTNIPSVATPNGQAAFLFLLTSALAPLIRLSYAARGTNTADTFLPGDSVTRIRYAACHGDKMIHNDWADNPQIKWAKETGQNYVEPEFLISSGVMGRPSETVRVLHLCAIHKSWAERWQKGKKIGNAEIRKELSAHPMGEPEEQMKELYNFFCLATHPNRELTPRRFLGEGNAYVLGVIVIGAHELVMVVDYCRKILEMWFWLTATVTYFYRETIAKSDKGYFEAYDQTSKEAQNVNRWLVENFNKLLKDAHEYWAAHPVKE